MLPDPYVAPGTLVPVLPELVGRERPLHLLVPTALAGLPKLRALLGHIRGFVKDHMPHGVRSP